MPLAHWFTRPILDDDDELDRAFRFILLPMPQGLLENDANPAALRAELPKDGIHDGNRPMLEANATGNATVFFGVQFNVLTIRVVPSE